MTNICIKLYESQGKTIEDLTRKTLERHAEGVEYSFGICQLNDKVTRTKTIKEGKGGMVEVPRDCPEGSRLVGAFHTHAEYQLFSHRDFLLALENGFDYLCASYAKQVEEKDGELTEIESPGLRCIDFRDADMFDKFPLLVEITELEVSLRTEKMDKLEVYRRLKRMDDLLKEINIDSCNIPIKI